MKKIIILICTALLFMQANAQTNTAKPNKKTLTQLSLHAGTDLATKHHFTSSVKMPLKGFNAGISFDKYWSWYGIGMDIDYMENEKPIYDDAQLSAKLLTTGGYGGVGGWYNAAMLSTTTSASKLTRAFAGIGPSFKYQSNNCKFIAELNLRAGITSTKGSALYFSTIGVSNWQPPFFTRDGDATGTNQTNGTFHHDGYDNNLLATVKSQIRLSYYVSPKIAINASTYYMHYFGSKAKYNYLDVTASTPDYWYLPASYDVSSLTSLGFTAGLSFQFGKSKSCNCKKSKTNNALSVLVKDMQTGLPLQSAKVTILGTKAEIYTGITDANGLVKFTKILDDEYKVTGQLNDIATTEQQVIVDNKNNNAPITLEHNDPRFTVIGKAINVVNKSPENNVNVTLANNDRGIVNTTKTENGEFSFQLDANSDYELVGKKANYISNIESISTKGLTRSKTLYVKLELGIQQTEVGKPISLQNIYYDVNKSGIKEESSTDLKKVIQFMKDNPSNTIEISSHTDSRGSDDYNLKLSQDRAQAVVNYLTSKGVNKIKLNAKGYGETKLVNNCTNGVICSEEQHQANRRTELTVTSF